MRLDTLFPEKIKNIKIVKFFHQIVMVFAAKKRCLDSIPRL